MKKQYILLAVAIVVLTISLIFLPIIGEILFIPFVYVFQYSCRSSNRREARRREIEQDSQAHHESPVAIPRSKVMAENETICGFCGAKIDEPNMRYCESCGAKVS